MIRQTVIQAQPQLVRKNTAVVIPRTVVVVQPSQNKAVSNGLIHQVKQTKQQATPPPLSVKQQKPQKLLNVNAAVSLKGQIKRNHKTKTKVKHVTADVSQESINKIKAIRGIGRGKILIIIGNGPSILEADLHKLKNIPKIDIMSINKPDSRLWPTTYWTFFDVSQMRRHSELWESYTGIIFNSASIKKQKRSSMQFKNLGTIGFSRDASKGINIGRSSVFASMQIALWMDYDKIYIFGCDMNPSGLNGKLHFYGDNPDVDPNIRKTRFKDEANHYTHAATVLNEDERSKFVFCSEYNHWDFIKKFGAMSHKTAVDHIIERQLKKCLKFMLPLA